MKIEWKKDGGAFVTLGDDAAASRKTIVISEWGGQAVVQVEPLFRSTTPFAKGRGNVQGRFSFGATAIHATMDDAVAAFITEYGRLGETGELKITVGAKVVTYAGAVLQSVVRGGKEGVRQEIVYGFVIKGGTVA
jgi:hypothetical protein